MEKRFQIFVSSTFVDLVDERQSVLRGILQLDHMPAGMELFPAVDESAWALIENVIDGSDYYVLIVGGRYGSTDDEGLGYTEKEYDYALSTNKPVIALLHKNPKSLPRDKTEEKQNLWAKLSKFREKVEKRHTCVYWTGCDELQAKVIVGLTVAFKRYPATGWVKADGAQSEETVNEILGLQRKIVELEKKIEENRLAPPKGTDDLVQGNEVHAIGVRFSLARSSSYGSSSERESDFSLQNLFITWNEIFGVLAPKMINECSYSELLETFRQYLFAKTEEQVNSTDRARRSGGLKIYNFGTKKDIRSEMETCIIQLRALGLIRESTKAHSLKDTNAYWSLTSYGDTKMVQLRAIRRHPEVITAAPGELPLTVVQSYGYVDQAE